MQDYLGSRIRFVVIRGIRVYRKSRVVWVIAVQTEESPGFIGQDAG